MAVKRVKPIQETFINNNASNASFGSDEILELGHCLRFDASGCSRILLEFMVNEVEAMLRRQKLTKATLNLKYAHGENLPPVWGIDVTEIGSEWAEGQGHVYDIPGNTNGASWFKPKGTQCEDYWEGGIDPAYAEDYIWKHNYWTGYQAIKDISIDVTEWVYSWLSVGGNGLGFLIKLSNEQLAEEMKTRLCFYGSETHTIYGPYLELLTNDQVIEKTPETPILDTDKLVIEASNLKESYYIGEKTRINILARQEYPKRVFSTKSLYANPKAFVPRLLWGIRDEYTGEMLVPFNPNGTMCSFDSDGNYFILDTDLLEPERYYRLLFEVDWKGRRRVFDSKNIFRVTKHGEI